MTVPPESSTPKDKQTVFIGLERIAKAAALVVGVVYAVGMVVVTLHVARFGLFGPGLLQAQYVIAGFWALLPMAIVALAVSGFVNALHDGLEDARSEDDESTPAPKRRSAIRRFFHALWFAIRNARRFVGTPLAAGFGFVLLAIWLVGSPLEQLAVPHPLATFARLFALLAVAVFATAVGVHQINERTWEKVVNGTTVVLLGCAAAFGYLTTFANNVYPYIPAEVGGGRPMPIRLALAPGAAGSEVGPARLFDVDSVYHLILTTADEFLLVHPTDSTRAVAISKSAVAMISAAEVRTP